MTPRDRLAALLHKQTWLSHGVPAQSECGYCYGTAGNLIAAGVTLAPAPLALDVASENKRLRGCLQWVFDNTESHVIAQFISAALAPQAPDEQAAP